MLPKKFFLGRKVSSVDTKYMLQYFIGGHSLGWYNVISLEYSKAAKTSSILPVYWKSSKLDHFYEIVIFSTMETYCHIQSEQNRCISMQKLSSITRSRRSVVIFKVASSHTWNQHQKTLNDSSFSWEISAVFIPLIENNVISNYRPVV